MYCLKNLLVTATLSQRRQSMQIKHSDMNGPTKHDRVTASVGRPMIDETF